MDGELRVATRSASYVGGVDFDVTEIGVLAPDRVKVDCLSAGESGYVVASIKSLAGRHDRRHRHPQPSRPTGSRCCPATGPRSRWCIAGSIPTDTPRTSKPSARRSRRFSLNDASISFHPETSEALGFGFRCGFLGLLHMEIVQERLERESDLDLVQTAPNVTYETREGERRGRSRREAQRRSRCELHRGLPRAHRALQHHRAHREHRRNDEALHGPIGASTSRHQYLSASRVMLVWDIPLAGDRLRLLRPLEVRDARLRHARLRDPPGTRHRTSPASDILVNGDEVDALSMICHRDSAESRVGRAVLKRSSGSRSREQLFAVALQAAIGGKIIARETISRPAQGRHGQVLWRRHHP